ncbi:hypothetical protein J6590_020723 [Homalodisca vitripennis]|nr:hypothetical protein J6590_020723 [Homalodisca vitripennis]
MKHHVPASVHLLRPEVHIGQPTSPLSGSYDPEHVHGKNARQNGQIGPLQKINTRFRYDNVTPGENLFPFHHQELTGTKRHFSVIGANLLLEPERVCRRGRRDGDKD